MRGSRNLRQGGPGQSEKKALTFFFVFFNPQLFNRSQMVTLKEGVKHFPGGGGPTFFRGAPIADSL